MSDLMCFDCGHKFEGIDIDDLNCCLNCGSNNYDSIDSLEGSYVDRGFKAGQQSKQAEVDELHKRIGDAIYDLQHIESAMWEEQVEHVLRILKGDSHES